MTLNCIENWITSLDQKLRLVNNDILPYCKTVTWFFVSSLWLLFGWWGLYWYDLHAYPARGPPLPIKWVLCRTSWHEIFAQYWRYTSVVVPKGLEFWSNLHIKHFCSQKVRKRVFTLAFCSCPFLVFHIAEMLTGKFVGIIYLVALWFSWLSMFSICYFAVQWGF